MFGRYRYIPLDLYQFIILIMKRLSLLFIAAFALAFTTYAQVAPTHGQYVTIGSSSVPWYTAYRALDESQIGSKALYQNLDPDMAENENFFISRVKPRDRFVYTGTQVRESLNPARKLLWWCPIGVSGWNALPAYFFNSEVFTMWSYVDIYGNWTAPFVIMPGAMTDICHKNGVETSVLASVPWSHTVTVSDGDHGSNFSAMIDGGAQKFLKYLKYYGIDGIGFNSEFYFSPTSFATSMKEFLSSTFSQREAMGWPTFHNCWYSLMYNSGSCGGPLYLSDDNCDWFHYNNYPTSDAYFMNYGWGALELKKSQDKASSFSGRSSFDVYAGINYQSGAGVSFPVLSSYSISVGLWGAHNMNMIFENRGENGSSPLQQQKTYQLISENSFTGSSYNPVNTPSVTTLIAHTSKATNFHGFSSFIVARSSLTCDNLANDPFVTYFNLGNGMFFNVEGETTFNNEWYNIGIQDYMPTWRWWWTKSFMGRMNSDVSSDMTAEFTWDDAWFGGSCLQISGGTDVSYLHLFKTKYKTANTGDKIRIRYKVLSGSGAIAWACTTEEKLTESAYDAEISRVISSAALPSDEWVEVVTNIGGRSSLLANNATLALIGLKFTNTTPDFKVLIGEISLTRGTSVTPQSPVIDNSITKTLASNYKGVDLKVIFNMPSDKEAPVYNTDVDTWYFKVYTQQEGQKEVMCTATTSWAAYVVGAPYDAEVGGQIRIGVSAVSLDGRSESAITWSNWMGVPDADIVEGFSIDKPVIKAGEEFTIGFDDPNHAGATWEIRKASDDSRQYSTTANNFTTLLPEEGLYDLYKTENGETEVYRGYIQISPAAVGAMPLINSFTANGSTDPIQVEQGQNVEFAYVGRPDADGMVSRGIQISTNAFGFPVSQFNWPSSGTQPFTLAFWFNINNLNPGLEGTNLLALLSPSDGWPMSDWGYFWCDILPDNRIKLVIRSTGATGNTLEIDGFEFTTGTWYHMALVMDYTNRRVATVYINGKEVGRLECPSPYSWQSSYYMLVGGTAANRASLDANLDEFQLYDKALSADEVEASMNHFSQSQLPESLIGYWDFENEPGSDNLLRSVGVNKNYTSSIYEKVSSSYAAREFAFTTGAPFISGEIYEIKTIPTWSLKGASVLSASGDCAAGEATVSYANEGQYTATLKLENGWGSATKEFSYVEVSASTGIEEVSLAEMQAFPNPFVDEVYVRFAEEGVYTIAVYDASGRQTGSSQVNAGAGEMINIPVSGASGIYYMKVYSGDTLLKAMKVIKN